MLFALLVLLTACTRVAKPEGWAGPRVSDGTLYVSIEDGKMAALDSADLSQRWVFPPDTDEGKKLKLEGIYGAPAIGKDAIYFGAYDGYVYALNSKDGAPRWRFQTGDKIVNTVTLTDDMLYIGSTDGKFHAIDTAKCTTQCLPDAVRAFDTGSSIWGSPLVTDRLIYVPTMDGRLHALTPDHLTPTQGFSFKADAGLLTDVTLAKPNLLIVGGIDQRLYAIDSATGEREWSFSAGNWFWGRPLIDGATIYVPNLDGTVRALDLSSGTEKWSFKAESSVRSSPVLASGTLVVIDTNGHAYGLDPETGTLKWGGLAAPVLLNKTVLSDPLLLDDGKLVVVAKGGDLIRIDPEDGKPEFVKATP